MSVKCNPRLFVITYAVAVLLALFGVLALSPAGHAVEPDEVLKDAKLEARARRLSSELRCLVCQNQSIDDSNAPLAKDLRLLVRERLKKGDTDQKVLDYIVARYGEFVLLRPPVGWHTALLWFAPLFVLFGGIWLARSVIANQRTAAAGAQHQKPLTEEELRKLREITGGENVGQNGSEAPGGTS